MTTDRLLPCPHCGEAEHLYPSYRNMGAGKPYAIDCLGCGADYVPRDGMDVIAMWNRRSPAQSASMGRVTDALRQVVLLADLFDVSDKTPEDALYILARQQETWANARAALDSPPDHGGGEGELCKPYVKRNLPGHAMDGGEVVVPFRSDFEMECILSMLDRASLPTQESEDGR